MDDTEYIITIFSKSASADELVEFCDCIECHNIKKSYDKFISKELPFHVVSGEVCLYEDELDSIYAIAHKLFGDVWLEYIERNEERISDFYKEDKIIYNNDKKKKISSEFCYGDFTSIGRNPWVLLKSEIEKEAKKRKINIEWDGEENLDLYKSNLSPVSFEFFDFCQEILDKNGGLEGISMIVNETEQIEEIEIMPEILEMILENTQLNEYPCLEEKIENNFNESINNIYIYKNFAKEQLLEYIKNNSINLKYISKGLCDDKEIILAALKRRCFINFKHTSERLRDDKIVIRAAIKSAPFNFKYASDRLKNDKDFILKVLDYNIDINYIGDYLKADRDIRNKIKKIFK